MGLEVVSSIDAESWDRFVSANPHANIYHTRQFTECFRTSEKYEPHTYFLENDDAVLACIIAVQTKVLGPHLQSLSSRCVVYGGILCSDEASCKYLKKHFGKLINSFDASMQRRTLFSEIRNVNDASRIALIMGEEGYRFSPHLNFLVDLQAGERQLYRNLASSLHRKLNRAQEKLEIVELSDDKDLGAFYSLVAATYNKAHIPYFDEAVFQEAWKILRPLGWLRITMAKYGDTYVAGRAALVYRDTIIDWFAGSTDEGYRHEANALLVWDMMKWGIDRGLKMFDFGGAGDPNKKYSVRDFKSRFNGQSVNYGRYTKIYSRLRYSVGRGTYATVRRFLF